MSKTVLITGASSGFGRESALLFQQQGWNVVATMRSPEREAALGRLDRVLVTRLDVRDADSVTRAVSEGSDRFGHIDVLINNAGYGQMGIFETTTPDQIREQFEVNVFGLMNVTRAVVPGMRQGGGGTIINVSSFGGVVAMPFGTPYNSSKFAVEGFSEALALELSAVNIRVKLIEPGSVPTNFRSAVRMSAADIPVYTPFATKVVSRVGQITEHLRRATPQDVARTIYEAATDESEQLRYVIGEDAQFFIDQKREPSEAEFGRIMRGYFLS